MGSERASIVHLITRLDLGGAQQNTLYCVEHHDRRRFRVSLWSGEGGLLDAQARGIRDADVRLLPWLRHPIVPGADARALVRLTAMLREVDLVHTHSSKAGIVGRIAARAAGVRGIVHTVHGWSFNATQRRATRRAFIEMERMAARLTDRIVCVSRADLEAGLALGIGDAAQYRLLRSGIDPSLYLVAAGARERVRASLGFRPEDVVVGCVANFKAQKGPLDFVESARRARERSPRLKFFIAGDGELRDDVVRAVREARLEDAVRLLGWRSDVPDLLAATDIFLLTSLFEGLPRVVLQAMAAGVAVVATNTGGVAEVVVDGVTGFLVPPGRPDVAAEAVARLGGDEAARRGMGAAGRSHLSAEFDIRRMVCDLEALYDETLERTPATSASHLGPRLARH